MDSAKKRSPDYTDIAYREAVSRLRYLLAESYSPQSTPRKIPQVHSHKLEDSGEETDASMAISDRPQTRHHHHVHSLPSTYRSPYYGVKRSLYADFTSKLPPAPTSLQVPKVVEGDTSPAAGAKPEGQQPPPELMAFIERQEDYIEQLEKESQYCREELTNLLSKVKEVISENEGLHEREKTGLLKSVFEYITSGGEEEEEEECDEDELEEKRDRKKSPTKKKRLEGPSIVFESRISELEAQLTQTKIELRKAQEEAETLKKKYGGGDPGSRDQINMGDFDSYRQQIQTLQKEKEELTQNVSKLSSALSQLRDKEADATQKVKRSFDLVDQAQFEKAQAELEVRRLKDELERQHEKLRDLLQEQGRRVQDERTQSERRYTQQVEQLTCDLSAQWDAVGKLQLELEKQRRTENELRRELQQKAAIIEELKKELQTKIAGLQGEAARGAAERAALEQELSGARLQAERAERDARQESAALSAEVAALRQRLDRADADLLLSRRDNLRLGERLAALDRELNLTKMLKEDSVNATAESANVGSSREKELTSMIMNMEAKHVQTVGELENMIQTQTDLMEKLKDECRSLTQKLEESSTRHKEERTALKVERAVLLKKLEQVWESFKELERRSLEDSEGCIPSPTGSFDQTTPMSRAMSQVPGMALHTSSSTMSSPSARGCSRNSNSSSPQHMPSPNSNTLLSPRSSPNTNRTIQPSQPIKSSKTKNILHNPIINRNQDTLSNSKNTSLDPITNSRGKNTNNSPQPSTASPQIHSMFSRVTTNQIMDETQITAQVQTNSTDQSSSRNIHPNPITESFSTSSQDPLPRALRSTQSPNESLPLPDALSPCRDKDPARNTCLLESHQQVPSSFLDPPAELPLQLTISPALSSTPSGTTRCLQNCQCSQHPKLPQTHQDCLLELSNPSARSLHSSRSADGPVLDDVALDPNPVPSPTLSLPLGAVSHHHLTCNARQGVARPPPLTLQDLATDNGSGAS